MTGGRHRSLEDRGKDCVSNRRSRRVGEPISLSRSGGEIGGTGRPCGGPTDGMLGPTERKTAWLHGAARSRKPGLQAWSLWLDRELGHSIVTERKRGGRDRIFRSRLRHEKGPAGWRGRGVAGP